MKKAKSFKLIIFSVAFCLSLLFGVLSFNKAPLSGEAFANYVTETTKYFDTTASVEYKNDNLVVSAKDGETLSIVNPLVISDFGMKIQIPNGAKSLEINFNSDSFVLHGNKNLENKFDKKIINKITLDFENSTAKLNDGTEVNGLTLVDNAVTVNVKVIDNAFTANVNGLALTQSNDYYKIAGVEKSTAYVSLVFGAEGEGAKEFAINYIDQKTNDLGGAFKQTFALTDGDVSLALPEFDVYSSLYTSKNAIVCRDGEEINLELSAYSVFEGIDASKLYLEKSATDNDKINEFFVGEKTKAVILNKSSEALSDVETLSVVYGEGSGKKVVGEIKVEVLDKNYLDGAVAPSYVDANLNEDAIDAFKDALIKATKVGDNYITLGKSLEIPSLKGLVKYDNIPYEKLKYTVYVNSPNDENKTSSTMKIKVDVPGEYKFFVMFYDGENSMESPIDNENIMKGENPDTNAFVFSFKIEDNAPLIVEANKETAGTNGYVGVRYSAVPFKIDAESYSPTYTLYYNENADATAESDGWIKVLKKSEVSSSYNEEKEFFTKEEINTINYDGKLDFTPVKKGAYRIDCEVSSGLTVNSDSASYLIKVSEPKLKVKPENVWVKNNKVSIIFLSVGTLCLIGIVVLLFVKPKERKVRTKKVTDED